MGSKILFLIGLLFSVFANSLAASSAERYVIAEEKKYKRYCKKENRKGKEKMKAIKEDNAFESIMLFDCFKREADDLKIEYPNGVERQINNLLEARIAFYNESINEISQRFDLNFRNIGSTIEEIMLEKRIYIKKEEDEKITQEVIVKQKVTNLEEAVMACKHRGFHDNSSDPLEVYLFDQCIKEFGFTPKSKIHNPANNLKIEKTKKVEVKKPAPVSYEVMQKKEIIVKKKPEVYTEPKEDFVKLPALENSTALPALEEPAKLPSPKELDLQATPSEGRVVCKIDAYGTKICRYEPKIKKNEGSLVNNLYLD